MAADIPIRPLGATGMMVSALGLGGYHIGKMQRASEAVRLVHAAIDAGITFMDNAWEYHEGRSETLMGQAIADRRERVFLMTKVCTHGRGKREAMRQLEQSLRRLRTDHLDLWQVHECVYENDPELHFARNGVIEALDEAKRQGKVRFVGFTGHKHPDIHLEMLAHEYNFDTCQLPLNCFDGSFRSFEQQVVPEAARQGIAVIGMKTFGGDGTAVKKRVVSAVEALRYAMSLPVAVTVTGIDSRKVLRQNLGVARGFRPLGSLELERVRARHAAHAVDGRFELYKTTATHEGPVGRKQHGYPDGEELTD